MKGMVFKGNDEPITNMNKHLASMKNDDGKRAKSSPFQHNDPRAKKKHAENKFSKDKKNQELHDLYLLKF